MPGKAETVIDYDCVPTYSQTLAAQIINMNDNVIVSQTSLKSGKIATVSKLTKKISKKFRIFFFANLIKKIIIH